MWSWLRRTYPSQWYTILQTFPPFGNDIFKIPKCQNQLRFWFKLAPSAWKHVPPCDKWFPAPGKSFMPYGRFPEGLSVPGYTKTAISTLFWAPTLAWRMESCITWWYTIPSARRKFEAFSKFPEGFGVPWDTQTLGKPSIRHETLAWRMESFITWWYMIPCARQEKELKTELIWLFWCTLGTFFVSKLEQF